MGTNTAWEGNRAPDIPRFVNHPEHGLTDEQVIFLVSVYEHGASALKELQDALVDRHNDRIEDRRAKAHRTTELYFTKEAYDRYEQAQKIEEQRFPGLVLPPPGARRPRRS
jgi:hypothetical protein